MKKNSNQNDKYKIDKGKANTARNVFSIISIVAISGYYSMINIGGFGTAELNITSIFIVSVLFFVSIQIVDRNILKKIKNIRIKKNCIRVHDLYFWFTICMIVFILFPWTSKEQNIFHSLSAIFRYIWLFCGIRLEPIKSKSNFLKSQQFKYLILTSILGVIDGSRTTWFIAFLTVSILSLDLLALTISLIILFILLCAIASVRSGWGINTFIISSVYGEGIGATRDYITFKNNLSPDSIESFYYILNTYMTPILYPINKVLQTVGFNVINIYSFSLNNVDNIMGGWFIGNDFAFFEQSQYFLVYGYMLICYVFTVILLDPISPVLSRLIPIIAIKSTPFIYWNFVYYILIIGLLFFSIKRISINRIIIS